MTARIGWMPDGSIVTTAEDIASLERDRAAMRDRRIALYAEMTTAQDAIAELNKEIELVDNLLFRMRNSTR